MKGWNELTELAGEDYEVTLNVPQSGQPNDSRGTKLARGGRRTGMQSRIVSLRGRVVGSLRVLTSREPELPDKLTSRERSFSVGPYFIKSRSARS